MPEVWPTGRPGPAAIALTVNAAEGATANAVVLLTPEQVDEAAKRSVDYRPPGT